MSRVFLKTSIDKTLSILLSMLPSLFKSTNTDKNNRSLRVSLTGAQKLTHWEHILYHC